MRRPTLLRACVIGASLSQRYGQSSLHTVAKKNGMAESTQYASLWVVCFGVLGHGSGCGHALPIGTICNYMQAVCRYMQLYATCMQVYAAMCKRYAGICSYMQAVSNYMQLNASGKQLYSAICNHMVLCKAYAPERNTHNLQSLQGAEG